MDEAKANERTQNNANPSNTERFIAATYDKLPPHVKVLVALFSAMNSSSASTQRFELPGRLWEVVRLGSGGPLIGESEETNWLKGVCDGVLLVIEHM
jgi:hypothetical protein